jgi:hypothetical protein
MPREYNKFTLLGTRIGSLARETRALIDRCQGWEERDKYSLTRICNFIFPYDLCL